LTTLWSITMLSFNIALLAMLFSLWPMRAVKFLYLQRIAMALLIVSVGVLLFSDLAAVLGQYWHWMFTRFAREIEHIAIMILVLRLFVTEQDNRCHPNSSAHSHN
jgi:hypothetical protein